MFVLYVIEHLADWSFLKVVVIYIKRSGSINIKNINLLGRCMSAKNTRKFKVTPYPTGDMTDEQVLKMFDKQFPKLGRVSIGDLKRRKHKMMYYELKRRGLVLTALQGDRHYPDGNK
jgi:hypothetical protein